MAVPNMKQKQQQQYGYNSTRYLPWTINYLISYGCMYAVDTRGLVTVTSLYHMPNRCV